MTARRAALIAVVVIALVAVAVVGATIGAAIVGQVRFGFRLTDQPARLRLTDPLEVTADVSAPLRITLDGMIQADVPFRQTVSLPLKGRYRTEFKVDTEFPIRFEVVYEGVLPVDTMAAIEANTDFNFNDAKYLRNLGFATEIPMKLDIPMKLRVPVDQPLRFTYDGPLTVELDQVVDVPIDTMIPAELRVSQDFTTPVTSRVKLRVEPPGPIPIVIDHADLSLRLSTLRLEVTENPDAPTRPEALP